MSTTIPLDTSLTPTQRMNAALDQAKVAWPEAANAKLLQVVLLEVAAASLSDDPQFAARVRARYAEMAPPEKKVKSNTPRAPRTPRATPKVSDLFEPLTPIKHIPDYEVTLEGPLDPYLLLEVFGAHQLARALNQRSPADLRKAAAIVQARNSGKKPTKTTKSGLIAFIVEVVTGLNSSSSAMSVLHA